LISRGVKEFHLLAAELPLLAAIHLQQ